MDAGPAGIGCGSDSVIISLAAFSPTLAGVVVLPEVTATSWNVKPIACIVIDDTGSFTSTSIVSSPWNVWLARSVAIVMA